MLTKKEDNVLDELDLLLIHLLQQDAQQPITQLARHLSRPIPTIRDRIKRLEKMSVIKGYTAVVDPARIGLPIKAIIQIKVSGVVKDSDALLSVLGNIAEVEHAYLITGDFEAIVVVNVQDVEHLRRLLYEVLPKVPGVSGTNSMLVLCEAKGKSPSPML
jgi:Lrp/AsnC family transcriptional regulator, leucine-responsive regulatory protein